MIFVWLGLLTTAVSLGLLLVAHAGGWRWLQWVTKPLASTGFLVVALGLGALDSSYGMLVLLALAFCWMGDLLLIPAGHKRTFVAGLGVFLLGHVVLIAAFITSGTSLPWLGGATLFMAAVALVTGRWLVPHAPSKLRPVVWLYICLIGLMVASAIGATMGGGPPVASAGAAVFAVSDIAVARHRFVSPSIMNKLWGLPLYYLGVLLIAWSVAS